MAQLVLLTRLCQVLLAALLGLAVVLVSRPLAAADANSPAALREEKIRDKPDAKSNDKPENKADKSDDSSRGQKDEISGKKADNSDTPPEAKEETKEDPCDPNKQLVNFKLRQKLCKAGVKFDVIETSEILGNPTGGLRQGARYEGLTDVGLHIDLRPSFHWRGEIFARAYQIHGRGLTGDNLGSLSLASSIEAARTTRLNELWYEHHFDYGRLRIGQQTIGREFFNPESVRTSPRLISTETICGLGKGHSPNAAAPAG